MVELLDARLAEATPADPLSTAGELEVPVRPVVRGKFLAAGDAKLYLRGVTYGTFRPAPDGAPYPGPATVERDFADMASNGFNCIRTYTVPPCWLLDLAQQHGLRVLVGVPWEEHVAFLEDRDRRRSIEDRVRSGVAACAGHPAVLAYSIGNEISSGIVRWYGARRIQRHLRRLYEVAKIADPGGLVTYINYPSTEYLDLPFLDFVAFNVYLEHEQDLSAYLARLQNLAGDRPLVLAEVGLDSRTHGEPGQASTLDWQIRSASTAGCAGVFLFAWTDEWYRGGYPIEDWDFGLTRRDRSPKPALGAVRAAFDDGPLAPDRPHPRISVVVCSYNGARLIGDCLLGLREQTYPDYEVIVVDDGSTDATASIAKSYGVRVISTDNQGLSSARNVGLQAANGEIVAYTDDDARPDPDWLLYLAAAFQSSDYVGICGPNIAPPGDGAVAECVANAPGAATHVLLTDTEAEHIPGCNMAFRKARLQDIGGFDPQFRSAGDDVDICWRLQERGWTLGFCSAAMVWHHRRSTLRAYWKQQVGYGKAEALLERKWPQKYNGAGYLTWSGRVYSQGLTRPLRLRSGRIYHGIWGTAAFQSLYEPATGMLESLPLLPEWYLATAALAILSSLSFVWRRLRVTSLPLVVALGLPLGQAAMSAAHASFPHTPASRSAYAQRRALTALLHLMQPLARLKGRLGNGLSPWRWRGPLSIESPRPREDSLWSEDWRPANAWVQALEERLLATGVRVRRGAESARWDLEVRTGLTCGVRVQTLVEEHGAGRQLVRCRCVPVFRTRTLVVGGACLALGVAASLVRARGVASIFGLGAVGVGSRALLEWSTGVRAVQDAFRGLDVSTQRQSNGHRGRRAGNLMAT